MSLTTLLTVKARLGLPVEDVKDDALLSTFIAAVSARFDNECNRSIALGNYSDEFEGQIYNDQLQLLGGCTNANTITHSVNAGPLILGLQQGQSGLTGTTYIYMDNITTDYTGTWPLLPQGNAQATTGPTVAIGTASLGNAKFP